MYAACTNHQGDSKAQCSIMWTCSPKTNFSLNECFEFDQVHIATIVFDFVDGCERNVTYIESDSNRPDLRTSLVWPETNLGQVAILNCPCGSDVTTSLLQASRYCAGSFENGAYWSTPFDDLCDFSDVAREICLLSSVRRKFGHNFTNHLCACNQIYIYCSQRSSEGIHHYILTVFFPLLLSSRSKYEQRFTLWASSGTHNYTKCKINKNSSHTLACWQIVLRMCLLRSLFSNCGEELPPTQLSQ